MEADNIRREAFLGKTKWNTNRKGFKTDPGLSIQSGNSTDKRFIAKGVKMGPKVKDDESRYYQTKRVSKGRPEA